MGTISKKDANSISSLLGENDTTGLTATAKIDNSTEGLYVHIVGNDVGASGGTSSTDDAAFTAAAGSGTPMMGFVTADSVDSGDVGVVGMLANRQLKVTLYDSGGSELAVGGGTQYTEDAASAANPIGNALNLIRADSLAAVTTTDGDNVAARGTNNGELYVKHVDSIAVTNAGLTELAGAINASAQMDVNIAASTATLTVASHAVTNVGTFAVQSTNQTGDNTIGRVKLTDGTDVADVLDLANSNPLTVAIVDSSGDQITSFGGGTQYTEDAAAAANPVGTALMLVREDGRAGSLTTTDGDNVAARGNNKGELYVKTTDSDALLTTIDADTSTLAGAVAGSEMQVDIVSAPTLTVNAHAVTNAGTFAVQVDGAALTSLQLADDVVVTLGTTTYTEAATKGTIIGAVRRDADTTLVDTTNEIGPLQMNAAGQLKVEVFSGETLPVSLTSTTVTGTVAVTQSGTWDEVGINDSGNSITVDNGGTFAVQVDGAALTALQLIDDVVYTDDTSTHSTGTSKGALMMAAATPTDTAVNANDIGALAMTVNRELLVQVNTALPAGTNAIGKLAANSGVDIGDVDVLSVVPGTGATNLGKAEDAGHTTGDVGVMALGVRTDSPNAANPGTTADYAAIATDMVGGIRTALYETDFAVLGTKHVKKYYTNAGAVTDGIVWSPAAGTRWYVTDIILNTSAAATVTLEDDLVAGDSVVMKFELAANSGIAHHFGTPLFSGEDAADLLVTTSAGNIYITVTGYEI